MMGVELVALAEHCHSFGKTWQRSFLKRVNLGSVVRMQHLRGIESLLTSGNSSAHSVSRSRGAILGSSSISALAEIVEGFSSTSERTFAMMCAIRMPPEDVSVASEGTDASGVVSAVPDSEGMSAVDA